jgi:hypothetical protein
VEPSKKTDATHARILPYRRSAKQARGWIALAWDSHNRTVDWLPYRCSRCLSEDHRRVRLRVASRSVLIKIPICDKCLNELERRRRWFYGIGVFLIAIITAIGCSLFAPGPDVMWKIDVCCFIGGTGILILRFIDLHLLGPVLVIPSPRGFDRVWVRFRNDAYCDYVAQCASVDTPMSANARAVQSEAEQFAGASRLRHTRDLKKQKMGDQLNEK